MVTAQLTPVEVGIHNVLIATDFSRSSNVALDLGLQLARDYQAKAYVVFVLPTDEFMVAGPDAYVAARDAACRDLKELKAQLNRVHAYVEGADYHLYLLEGQVAQSILDFADQKKVDLLVLGTHGRTGLSKALLGSVAERVFRGSTAPVLTIGPNVHEPVRVNAPRNIMVAADFTPASERAVRYAASLAREHESTLTLMHVVNPKEIETAGDRSSALLGAKTKLEALLGQEARGIHCCARVESGKVVARILQTVDEIDADLLVMGVRPPGAVLGHVMWPHAYEIVRESACPVLTVRGAAK